MFEGNQDGTVGGSYFSLFFLAEGIDRTRYTPVVGFRRDIPFVQRFRDAGLEVHIIPGHRAFRSRWLSSPAWEKVPGMTRVLSLVQSVIGWAAFAFVSGPRWASLLKHQRISLVHANNSVTRCHDLMWGAMLSGVPAITHERGINSRFSRMARFFSKRLAAIICISNAVRTNLEEHRIGGQVMPVVYNAVDPSRVQPTRSAAEVRRAFGVTDDQPVLAMLGNIRRWKGQDVVVKAMIEVTRQFPTAVCFFVGEATEQDKPFAAELDQIVAAHNLSDNVRFVGYQEHVADFIQAADATIHASVQPEPFGRVLVEAMALRKAVVGSRSGAVPEIVQDGVTGRTFEAGNPSDLAACLIDVLSDRKRCQAMGEAGYQRLLSTFGIAENLTRTQMVYDSLLASAAARPGVNS